MGLKGHPASLCLTWTTPAGGLHAFDRGHIFFSTKELYFEVLGQCFGHYWTVNRSWIIVIYSILIFFLLRLPLLLKNKVVPVINQQCYHSNYAIVLVMHNAFLRPNNCCRQYLDVNFDPRLSQVGYVQAA